MPRSETTGLRIGSAETCSHGGASSWVGVQLLTMAASYVLVLFTTMQSTLMLGGNIMNPALMVVRATVVCQFTAIISAGSNPSSEDTSLMSP
jgi:hypothetical protein